MEAIDYDELYEHLGIEPISKSGGEDRFHCIDAQGLHKNGDRTGKLFVNRDKNCYICFVCGGGPISQLVAHIKGIDESEAKKWLRDFTNHSLVEDGFTERLERLFGEKKEEASILPYFSESILDNWKEGHLFFEERGISEETRVGFLCGYDEKTDAIVFPHFWDGKLVGWQRRHLSSLPKYQMSPDFPKRETLWGFDQASGTPILVESIPTALSVISSGLCSIATFGASVSSTQIKYLRRFTDGVILAPDNDPPGEKWLEKIINELGPFVPIYRVGTVDGIGADLGDLPKGKVKDWISDTLKMVLGPGLYV